MNWIQQNKFLSGFIAAMVIGVGGLGYLLMSAKGHHDEVQTEYEGKVAELNRLEKLKPYPEEENVKEFEVQKKKHAAAIEALRKNLAAQQLPVVAMTPEQFQNEARNAVNRLVEAAGDKVKLPGGEGGGKFYLGFDPYREQLPRPEAAPVLGRQLAAAEMLVKGLIDSGVDAITKFDRDNLPEEEGKTKKEKEDGPGKSGGPKSDKGGKELVTPHTFTIEFIAEQSRFTKALNDIIKSNKQFFIPRLVTVRNTAETPPARTIAAPVAGAEEKRAQFIFGAEKVATSMLVEMIDFAEPTAK
jgi:hypothetical protein